jgi:hypothetical protein
MAYGLQPRKCLLTISLVLLVATHLAAAQTASDHAVKAAYIYNFAKFVEWPAASFGDASTAMRFCILNDPSFGEELNRIVAGKLIASRPVEVVHVQDGGRSRNCQVLYINSVQSRQTRRVIEVLRGASVLTVGESDDFLEDGGVIDFVLQDDRIHFHINRKSANDAGLRISSRLLAVARRVLE